MRQQAPTIFESFNARALVPTQVSQRFVPSDHFSRLIKRRHSVIVGPRGSGKTTLLKMLQQPALETWKHVEAEEYCARIDFTGVFVATDMTWSAQLEALGGGQLDSDSQTLFMRAAFTTHVLRAVTIAMLNRVRPTWETPVREFRRVCMSDPDEAKLVRYISEEWGLKTELPSLLALKHALRSRLKRIKQISEQEKFRGEVGRHARLAEVAELHLPFLHAVSSSLEFFDDIIGQPMNKWALAFDELELAPSWIVDELLRAMRSTDERLLFKLALSPFGNEAGLLTNALAAAPGNDFEQIPLWYAEKRDGIPFCEKLWDALLADRELPLRDPRKVLGLSYFETPRTEWAGRGTAYRAQSRLGKRILRLYQTDKSFRRYLDAKKIDPRRLELVAGDQRASDLRKVAPLIPIREFYRSGDWHEQQRQQALRSRKLPTVYAGAESLFAITEGNPRWFIGIVEGLLDGWRSPERRIPPTTQAREIERAGHRFAALLRNLPSPNVPIVGGDTGLHSLIDAIGDFFHTQVVGREFVAEPPATFTVDARVGKEVIAILGDALNAGAIVYVPENTSQLFIETLRGKRFRVSYLLAPIIGFPLRLGKPVNLSSIIGNRVEVLTSSALELPL